MKSKVIENKKIKEEKLLASALELFSEHDIKDITIQDIVDKAGVAKGTFYLYFEDKYQIQNVLIHKESAKIFEAAYTKLLSTDLEDFESKIIFVLDQVLLALEFNPFILRFIKRNLSWGIFQDQISVVMEKESQAILRFNELAQQSGYFFEDPYTTLYIIIEMVSSTGYSSIAYEQPKPIKEFKPRLFSCIRAILREGRIEP